MIESSITVYITLVAISGVLSIFLCLYSVYKRKDIPGSHYLILLTALQAVYIFAFAFELASDTLEEIKRWIMFEYIGIGFAPVLGLLLVFRYIGAVLPRLLTYSLFVIPAVTLFMIPTNDRHHLFYKLIYLRENTPTPMADVVIGEWYIVQGAYTFGCLLAGGLLLIRQWRKTNRAYRLQLFTLISGQFVPMIASFLYLMGVTPNGMDPVPFVLCITSAMYIWAMMSTHMLRITPIAKESLFESMAEGVLVLDLSEKLVDYNGAAQRMLPQLKASMIGDTLDVLWKKMCGSKFPVARAGGGIQGHVKWQLQHASSDYEVRSSVIKGKRGDSVGSLLMLIDATERYRLQEQLKQQAYYDGLTGIYNRAQFIRRARTMLETAYSGQQPMSLILFDIDHFKQFNDTYGHDTGDAVLIHAVTACRSLLPGDALFGRYGGEEFVVAVPGYKGEAAAQLANQLREALPAAPLASVHGPLTVTASFGVTSGHGQYVLEAMLREADEALYEAKRSGRNTVHTAIRSLAPKSRPISS
ncbi:histidine kinase N-terminal 7TM domain-containing protein [Paenibacillus sp. NPDC057967]|uniref:histidine kinase N-terminal 7TM domain-containing diguanylate cyclase n=1 Tax=Paenibacillus sp. NPDC057967 TaxID=3346293 RepID=UPI0036DDCD1E